MKMSIRLKSVLIIAVAVFLGFFVYPQAFNKGADFLNAKLHREQSSVKFPHFFAVPSFHLGLDLVGGTHLEYQADLSGIKDQSPADAMSGVRDVIERRVNLFGVAEPLVQVEGKDRLVVELAGIKDVNLAIQMIGQTPFLEFKTQRPQDETNKILDAQKKGQMQNEDPYFVNTALTGKYLKSSQVTFSNNTLEPQVAIEFDAEGTKLFADMTAKNIGKPVAIYLDGSLISAPVVQNEITNGSAVITGRFTPQQAKDLANRLNAGALPVPISLVSQQTVGASLGQESLTKSLKAGLYGLMFVALFMILYYRLPGVVSVVALLIYVVLVLTLYKVIPVTLSLSGMAGFILSLGIAVDANVLIYARMREELKSGKTLQQSLQEGFRRAWPSIRDGHVTTLLSALILYIFTSSVIKGFALTLGVGVLLSLFTATIVTRILLENVVGKWSEHKRWLF